MTASLLPPATACLFAQNCEVLLSGIAVLQTLPLKVYTSVDARCLGGSIGGHVRHCIEFYQCFLAGLDNGLVDYDARARDLHLETDPIFACETLRQTGRLLQRAAATQDLNRTLNVIENHEGSTTEWSASSVSRELRSLLSHTIHHYALIAILTRLHGLQTPEGFGIAPSTLRHRAQPSSLTPCAQ